MQRPAGALHGGGTTASFFPVLAVGGFPPCGFGLEACGGSWAVSPGPGSWQKPGGSSCRRLEHSWEMPGLGSSSAPAPAPAGRSTAGCEHGTRRAFGVLRAMPPVLHPPRGNALLCLLCHFSSLGQRHGTREGCSGRLCGVAQQRVAPHRARGAKLGAAQGRAMGRAASHTLVPRLCREHGLGTAASKSKPHTFPPAVLYGPWSSWFEHPRGAGGLEPSTQRPSSRSHASAPGGR